MRPVTQKINARPHRSSSHLRVLPAAAPTTGRHEAAAATRGDSVVQRVAVVSMIGLALNLAWMVLT